MYLLTRPPVTFFVARFLLEDEGVLAGRSRHGFCPQSFHDPGGVVTGTGLAAADR